jgi:hypothetical protein
MSERYKGMWLDAKVMELADGSGWTAEVHVTEEDGPDDLVSRFVLKLKFPTEDAALGTALASGRKIVDDKIKGMDIGLLIEHETRLPATHRKAFGSRSDDVASDADGRATRIPSTGNPDDRFS